MVGEKYNGKLSMSDITIVTAFFDIGRSNWNTDASGNPVPYYVQRSTDSYFEYFSYLAQMKNDMIIYCETEEHKKKIETIRREAAPDSKTTIMVVSLEPVNNLKNKIQSVQRRQEYIDLIDDPRMPEYWNADYVLINYLKTEFVNNAIDNGLVETELAAWIDFGYVRGPQGLPSSLTWNYDFDATKMHYFTKLPIDMDRPIFDIIKTNTVYVMGCHIVGGKKAWKKHLMLSFSSLHSLLDCNLIDDDQTILLMNYRNEPDLFELHPIKVSQEEWYEWNVAFRKYNKEG
jgi:protein YibB